MKKQQQQTMYRLARGFLNIPGFYRDVILLLVEGEELPGQFLFCAGGYPESQIEKSEIDEICDGGFPDIKIRKNQVEIYDACFAEEQGTYSGILVLKAAARLEIKWIQSSPLKDENQEEGIPIFRWVSVKSQYILRRNKKTKKIIPLFKNDRALIEMCCAEIELTLSSEQ